MTQLHFAAVFHSCVISNCLAYHQYPLSPHYQHVIVTPFVGLSAKSPETVVSCGVLYGTVQLVLYKLNMNDLFIMICHIIC